VICRFGATLESDLFAEKETIFLLAETVSGRERTTAAGLLFVQLREGEDSRPRTKPGPAVNEAAGGWERADFGVCIG